MAVIMVNCPCCKDINVKKYGKNENGKQRYYCNNPNCSHKTFMIDYDNKGCEIDVKLKILKLAMNGCGIRDTARALDISVNTVISELKKKNKISSTST